MSKLESIGGKTCLKPAFCQTSNSAKEAEVQGIIKRFRSNIAELYRLRIISKILQDPTIYDESTHLKCVQEVMRLKQVLSYDEIGQYLKRSLNIVEDTNMSRVIEEIFDNKLKEHLVKRKQETNRKKLIEINKKIRQSWDDLKAVLAEEDILSYALIILRNTV